MLDELHGLVYAKSWFLKVVRQWSPRLRLRTKIHWIKAKSLFTPEFSFNIAIAKGSEISIVTATFRKKCIYNVVLQFKRGHQDAFVLIRLLMFFWPPRLR